MIRTTEKADFAGIIELATACGLFEPDQTELLEAMLRSPNELDVWFTDCSDQGPVGVAYLAPEKMTLGTWNLYWIAVHPSQQGRGRGSAMLKHVEQWLADKGQRLLLVETSGTDDFENVRRFYAKNGYQEEARIRDFYDVGISKVIYRKQLQPSLG